MKKRRWLVVILAGIVTITLLKLAFSAMPTENLLNNLVSNQLQAIKNNQLESAYKMTSHNFQRHTSLKDFTAAVDYYPILKTFNTLQFIDKRIDKNSAHVIGLLQAKDSEMIIEYQLIFENAQWVIQTIRLSPPEALANRSDPTGMTLRAILVSDTANVEGYTPQSYNVIPASSKQIFLTVQITAPIVGAKIQVRLYHLPTKNKFGPLVSDISETGDILKTFVFTRGPEPWPLGEYQATVTISTGATESIKFHIK